MISKAPKKKEKYNLNERVLCRVVVATLKMFSAIFFFIFYRLLSFSSFGAKVSSRRPRYFSSFSKKCNPQLKAVNPAYVLNI